MPWLLWLQPIRAVVEVGVAQGGGVFVEVVGTRLFTAVPLACAL